MRYSIIIYLILLSASFVQAQPKIEKDIVYGKVGERELKLDIARPTEGKGPYPTIVCVHGGGWRLGNKRDVLPWLECFAKEGYVAIGVGYRLAPDHVFPAQIEDCKTAVRFLRTNAEKYQIKKDRIGALGFSAGGHLVALMGLTDPKAGFDGKLYPEESSAITCVVDYFGPTDFAMYAKDDAAQRSTFAPLLGAKYDEKPTLHEKASPINHVRKDAPPFLIFHGTKDWLVPLEHSQKFATKLKDAGSPVKLVEVADESHGWTGAAMKETTLTTLKFFAEHLKP